MTSLAVPARRQETVSCWYIGARELARYDAKSAGFFPFLSGNFSADSVSFFDVLTMGCLCQLPGGHALEKQSYGSHANSTHLPAARRRTPELAPCPAASVFLWSFARAKSQVFTLSQRWRNSPQLGPEDPRSNPIPLGRPDGTKLAFGGPRG